MSVLKESANAAGYFSMPDLHGIEIAPWRRSVKRIWGKRHMIEFLVKLANAWSETMYEQMEEHDNFAPIILGDISPEGGTNRWDKVKDHSSHKMGVDVDLYVFRTDGKLQKTHCREPKTYDLVRTTELARLVFKVALVGSVDKFYYQDQKVINALNGVGLITPWQNHLDHFHIRLKLPKGSK